MAEFDENRVTAQSRVFASELFARFPEFRQHVAMERLHNEDRWTLVVHVRAPSGDPRCELVVWVDGGYEPSVQYDGWHTHETVWGAGPAAVVDLRFDPNGNDWMLLDHGGSSSIALRYRFAPVGAR